MLRGNRVQASAKRIVRPTGSIVRIRSRGLLLSVLEEERLLIKLEVFPGGGIVTNTTDWDSYWAPALELNRPKLNYSLCALHSAWRGYIRSGCNALLRQDYCFRYFCLLDNFLRDCGNALTQPPEVDALAALLGFECFGISFPNSTSEILGAGTCTVRNPSYLLAKLKMPDAMDDSRFLPLITVSGTDAPELFYHYRQYALSSDSPISLLLFLSASEAKRSASFTLINSLAGNITHGIDPRTQERARRLSQNVIRPIILSRKYAGTRNLDVEFVDIGAGSGSLASSICRQIQSLGELANLRLRFRIWFLDLKPADPTRFFRHRNCRDAIDSLAFVGSDYREWLARPRPLPTSSGLRIALVSKLLNNQSSFSVRCLSRKELDQALRSIALIPTHDEYLPSRCLSPSGKGAQSLSVSSTRIALEDGWTFPQLSLTEFYRGLCLAMAQDVSACADAIFLPIRKTNPQSLVAADGTSMVSGLAEICDYVIIEDADLTANGLVEHATAFNLHSITITDMTRAMRLASNRAYVIGRNESASDLQLQGERIW